MNITKALFRIWRVIDPKNFRPKALAQKLAAEERMPLSAAAREAAKLCGCAKGEIYKALLDGRREE